MRGEKFLVRVQRHAGEGSPRMRGEKSFKIIKKDWREGSPPHARGKVSLSGNICPFMRITPACAGKRLKKSQYKAIFSSQCCIIPLVLNKVEAP